MLNELSVWKDLYAVAIDDTRICPPCAFKRYGDEFDESALPKEATVVMDDDHWKHQIDGPCADCGDEVSE